jgi:Tfp pilus assembly protein PilV
MMRPSIQRSPAGRRRRGLTLVEILIAIIMLTVGVMGLLGSTAAVAKQMGGGVRQTVAATIAQARIDSLTSLSCASLTLAGVASGTSTKRGIAEKWTVTDGKNVKNIAVEITIPRRATKLLYTTVIPCRDGT